MGSGGSEARGREVGALCLEDIGKPLSGFLEPGVAGPSHGRGGLKFCLVEAFEEEAALVAEHFWFDDEHVGDSGGGDLHGCELGLKAVALQAAGGLVGDAGLDTTGGHQTLNDFVQIA